LVVASCVYASLIVQPDCAFRMPTDSRSPDAAHCVTKPTMVPVSRGVSHRSSAERSRTDHGDARLACALPEACWQAF
jgi:hypothetical protein